MRSQPGEGATFTVLLPIEADVYAAYLEAGRTTEAARRVPPVPPPGPMLPPPPPGRAPPKAPTPAPGVRRPTPQAIDRSKIPFPVTAAASATEVKRVLVADDEPTSAASRGQLRRDGYDVLTAEDGEEALPACTPTSTWSSPTSRCRSSTGWSCSASFGGVSRRAGRHDHRARHGRHRRRGAEARRVRLHRRSRSIRTRSAGRRQGAQARTRSRAQDAAPAEPARARRPLRLIGQSPAIRAVYAVIEKVADTPTTVLITGESGRARSSSPRAARAIVAARQAVHQDQLRRDPEDADGAELFGYEKGAFTGAVGAKPGRFELAARRARCSSTRSARFRSRCR